MNTISLTRFTESIGVATVFTALSLALAHFMGWSDIVNANIWEVLAAFTSYSCTYMCVMQTRWNYPMGILSTMLLAYVFFGAGLYGSMALNLYLVPTVIIGYFMWGRDEVTRPVEHVRWNILPVYVFWTVLTYAGAWGIVNYFGGQMAGLDSWLLIGSIFAQFLLDRKKIETWLIWITVNVVSIYVYFEAGLYLLAFQFAYFLANAVWGYWQWWKTMERKKNVQ